MKRRTFLKMAAGAAASLVAAPFIPAITKKTVASTIKYVKPTIRTVYINPAMVGVPGKEVFPTIQSALDTHMPGQPICINIHSSVYSDSELQQEWFESYYQSEPQFPALEIKGYSSENQS